MERFAFHPKESTRITLAMIFVYLIQWGAQYIGYNYLPIYIDSLSFSTNSTTGVAIAVGAVTTTLAQPFWGQMADRAKTKNRILVFALIIEAATALLFFQKLPNLPVLLLCVILFYIAFLAPQTLIETIVVENVHKASVRFGVLRCFASAGCALTAFVFGLIGNMTDQKAFGILALCSVGTLIPLIFMPVTKGHASEKGEKISYRKLFSNRRFMLFLGYGLALFFCGSTISAFFPIYISTAQGLNAGVDWYSKFMSVTILLEAAVLFFGAKTFAKMNPYKVLIIPLIAGIFRMAIIVLAKEPADMLIYPLSHAMWFGPLWSKVAPFIQAVVPEEMRATGQSMWVITTCGVAPVLGSLTAGAISDAYSIRFLYVLVCGLMVILSLLFAVLFLRQHKIDRAEGWRMNM